MHASKFSLTPVYKRVLVANLLEETEFLVLGMITKAFLSNDQIFENLKKIFSLHKNQIIHLGNFFD